MASGILYLVSTPIGNLEDITLRALRTLREADYIACEDTRTSGILLKHYEITGKKTISFHSHTGAGKEDAIIKLLEEGANIALISDAGTPGISDPAYSLVRKAIEAGITLCPIPGASAVLSALICSGLQTHHFTYLGFLPIKKGRKTLFESLQNKDHTVVIYESVHRIEKTLAELEEYFGSEHQIVVGRELTKKFEEFVRGTTTEVREHFKTHPMKGEFVVCF